MILKDVDCDAAILGHGRGFSQLHEFDVSLGKKMDGTE